MCHLLSADEFSLDVTLIGRQVTITTLEKQVAATESSKDGKPDLTRVLRRMRFSIGYSPIRADRRPEPRARIFRPAGLRYVVFHCMYAGSGR